MPSQEKVGTNVRAVQFSTSPIRPTGSLQEGKGLHALSAGVISTGALSHIQLHSQTILASINQLDPAYLNPQQKKKIQFYKPNF